MSSDAPLAIQVDHVSKLFHKQNQRTFKELIPALLGGKKVVETFWALDDVNFEVRQGETIGIIGPNGSGKSTLLKLIAGVSQPTTGKITVNGKIAPLIELGAGFHPELTGRENVYLNGIILGMTREEVKAKFQEIVDFAELWDFIDQPVKHYSSGMYLRLAFAVAVHTDPDILLVDEILAVGDEKFQNKCLARIQEMLKYGTTLVIVSHQLGLIEKYCEHVLVLDKGKCLYYGAANDAVTALNKHYFVDSSTPPSEIKDSQQWGDMKAKILEVKIENGRGEPIDRFLGGEDVDVSVSYENPHQLEPLYCSIGIYRDDDVYVCGVSTFFEKLQPKRKEQGSFLLQLPKNEFSPGRYYLRVCLFSDNETSPHHFWHKAIFFDVAHLEMKNRGLVNFHHSWKIEP